MMVDAHGARHHICFPCMYGITFYNAYMSLDNNVDRSILRVACGGYMLFQLSLLVHTRHGYSASTSL